MQQQLTNYFMDTGHVKQVASFEKLLGFCNAHGAMFNPSKAALQPAALSALLTSAQDSIEAVRTARLTYQQLINARKDAFDGLPKFMTRVVNVLAASEVTKATLEDAYSITRKFKWTRARSGEPVNAEGEMPAPTRSNSQLDFDSRADNFEALVRLVSLVPTYQPNEADLQVAALATKVSELRAMSTAVISAQVTLSNARAHRNGLLYANAGIHGLAKAAKRYVKGAFGTQSVAYYQIRGIHFVNYKPV
jgi:hypothetical protein